MSDVRQHLADNFKRHFGTDMEEQAKPLSMSELQTANDYTQGQIDKTRGFPLLEGQSTAYNEGYLSEVNL